MDDHPHAGFTQFALGLENLLHGLWGILMMVPRVPQEIGHAMSKVLASDANAGLTCTLLVLCCGLTLVPSYCVRRWPCNPRFSQGTFLERFVAIVGDIGIDLGGAALIAAVSAALIFNHATALDQLAIAVLWMVVQWRICLFGLDVFIAPTYALERKIPVEPVAGQKARIFAGAAFGLTLLFVAIVPVLLRNEMALDPARSLAFLSAALASTMAFAAVYALSGRQGASRGWLFSLGLATSLGYLALWTFSILGLDFTLYDAITGTASLIWIYLILLRLGLLALPSKLHAEFMPSQDAQGHGTAVAEPDTSVPVLLVQALRRFSLVLYIAVAIAWIARIWLVEITQVTGAEHWPIASSAIHKALLTALVGYSLYEVLRTWSAAKFGPERVAAIPGLGDGDNEIATGSRLATLLPIVSRILLIFFLGVALLVGMSDYGINIGPILAGAGIFGLAISFGSQALVRDIVAGFFYIVDDAFRVGEYIDTGRQKGTVERISLRSMRLRHQNGQVHTVPYGQLGSITNFSRDWTTIKFNLRLARDSDLEKVRKTAKKTGLALMEDADLGREFLEPLKMQGIADVLDNALLVRFKLTCLPLRASYCQREAVKRLYAAFVAQGVRFAVNTLVVETRQFQRASFAPETEVPPN